MKKYMAPTSTLIEVETEMQMLAASLQVLQGSTETPLETEDDFLSGKKSPYDSSNWSE